MDNRILLVEQWGSLDNILFNFDSDMPLSVEPLIEAKISQDKKNLYFEGVFLQAEVVNGNKRFYPKRILEEAVNKYINTQINRKQSLGEINHPATPYVNPKVASHIIEKLWWDGNNVMGRARVVEGDNAEGDKLAALIRAGWIPSVSSRGLGSLKASSSGKYNVVQEGFELTVGVDVVWGPSAPDAYVRPISESTDNSITQPANNSNPFGQIIKNIQKTNTK